MSKAQPTPEPAAGPDPQALAAADLRDAAAAMRDMTDRLGRIAAATEEAQSAFIGAANVLVREIADYQRAQRLLIDVHDTVPLVHLAAATPAPKNGKADDA